MLRNVIVAWLFTVVVEVPVVGAFYRFDARRMALTAAIATTVTNLTMNLVLPGLVATVDSYLVIGESLALLLEAAAYFAMARPQGFGLAILASGVANTASFGLGLVLSPLLFGGW